MVSNIHPELIGWFNLLRYEAVNSPWESVFLYTVLLYIITYFALKLFHFGEEHQGRMFLIYTLAGIYAGILITVFFVLLPAFSLGIVAIWLLFSFAGTLSALVSGLVTGNWAALRQALNIIFTSFYADPDKPLLKSVLNAGSRLIWQQPQSLLGHCYSMSLCALGLIRKSDRFEETLMIRSKLLHSRGVSLGIFLFADSPDNSDISAELNLANGSSEVVRTLRHELGHYLQSKKCGWLYLFKIGIPSYIMQGWTESDADRLSDNYLMHNYGVAPILSGKSRNMAIMRCMAIEKILFIALIVAGSIYSGSYGCTGAFLAGGGLVAALNLKQPLKKTDPSHL